MSLLLASCQSTAEQAEPGKLGGECTAGQEKACEAPFVCFEGRCSQICKKDKDCAKNQICANDICKNVETPLCLKDDDCKSPGQCETIRDAYCEGGRCHYIAKTAGTVCDDENNCTVDDQCDGQGNCSTGDYHCMNGKCCHYGYCG